MSIRTRNRNKNIRTETSAATSLASSGMDSTWSAVARMNSTGWPAKSPTSPIATERTTFIASVIGVIASTVASAAVKAAGRRSAGPTDIGCV